MTERNGFTDAELGGVRWTDPSRGRVRAEAAMALRATQSKPPTVLPEQVERLIELATDIDALLDHLTANPELVSHAVSEHVGRTASHRQNAALQAAAGVIGRTASVGVDGVRAEMKALQTLSSAADDVSVSATGLLDAVEATADVCAELRAERVLGLIEDLLERVANLDTEQPVQERRRMLQLTIRFGLADVEQDEVQRTLGWLNHPSWADTWRALRADPLLVSPSTLAALTIIGDVDDDEAAMHHASIIRRLLQFGETGMDQAEVENDVLLVLERLAQEDTGSNEWMEQSGQVAPLAYELIQRSGAGWLCRPIVAVAERAVQLAKTTNDPSLGDWLHSFCLHLSIWIERFEGPAERYPEAVAAIERAVELEETTNNPDLAERRIAFSDSLSTWIERFGGPTDRYPETITAIERAIELAETTNDPNLGARLNNYSNQLSTWIERFGGPTDRYPETITVLERAIELAETTNDPDLGLRLNNYSNQLATWIERFGGPTDRYPETITAIERAIELAETTDDPDVAMRLANYSNRLSTWIERFGGPTDRYPETITAIERAIELAETTNDPNLGARLNTYSTQLSTWIERFGGPTDRYPETVTTIERAIELAEATNDPNLGARLKAYAVHLSIWIQSYGGPAERYPETVTTIERAIELAEATNDPNLGGRLNVYSAHLSTWIERFGGPTDRYPEAITVLERAIELAETTNDPWLGDMLHNYSLNLSTWIERFGGPTDRYPETITAIERAIELAETTNHSNLGMRLDNYSNQLSTWIERFGGPTDRYPETITAIERAIELAETTNDPNLGARLNNYSNQLSTWIERFGGPTDRYPETITAIERAIELAESTNDPNLGRFLSNYSSQLSTWIRQFGGPADRYPEFSNRVRHFVAERVATSVVSEALNQLQHTFPDVARRVALGAISVGDPADAITTLEAVRGLKLGERAARTAAEVDRLETSHPQLAEDFRAAVRSVAMLEALAELNSGALTELRTARAKVRELTLDLQRHAPQFARAADAATIQAALTPEQRCVWLLQRSDNELLAVVAGPASIDTVTLPIDPSSLETVLSGAAAFPLGVDSTNAAGLTAIGLPLSGPIDEEWTSIATQFRNAQRNHIAESSRIVWDSVADPILRTLSETVNELIVVPVGALALLPVHAAGVGDRWLLDRVAVRYGVTAASAMQPRRQMPEEGPVLQPEPTIPALSFARFEARALAEITAQEHLSTGCSVAAATKALRPATWLHTCSHITVDQKSRSTALQLIAPEVLTVADCETLPRHPRAEAFIAACCGKVSGLELPDEVVGFPNALLAAGFQRVIAASWQIGDLAAMLLSVRYHQLRRPEPDRSAALTLRRTQRWLRDSDAGAIAAWLRSLGDEHSILQTECDELARKFDRSSIEFSHPADWAALAMTGA